MSAVATARILYAPSSSSRAGQRSPWIWPLPELDGEAPCVLSLSRTDRLGFLELGYRDCSLCPVCCPVFAAQEGLVAYASNTGNGPVLCIDHPGGWSTQYAELERLLARVTDRFRGCRKERVRAGDVIGHARPSGLRILFAASRPADDALVVPELSAWMPEWTVVPWSEGAAVRRRCGV